MQLRQTSFHFFGIPAPILAMGLIALWGAPLFFDGLSAIGLCHANGDIHWIPSVSALLFGMVGVVGGCLGWFANAFIVQGVGLLLFGRSPSFVSSVCGVILALTSFYPATLPIDMIGREGTVCRWGPGFWMWLSVSLLLALIGLVGHSMKTKKQGS